MRTHTLEPLERPPDLDALFVPIGGGSGAAGACVAAAALRPELRVIGVQSEAAPAAYRSWTEGRIAQEDAHAAEGLATRIGFELPQQILREHLETSCCVSEDEIRDATLALMERPAT